MTISQIKLKLLDNGVIVLQEYGYPDVTSENILIDEIYKVFFKNMLKDIIITNENAILAIEELLNLI